MEPRRKPQERRYHCPHCHTYLFDCDAEWGKLHTTCPNRRCRKRLLVLLGPGAALRNQPVPATLPTERE